jgi:DNA recombination-mediator protein A
VDGESVIQAAPIGQWMVGRPIEAIRTWARSKGGWILNPGLALNKVGAEVADEAGCFSIKTSVDILRDARRVGIVGSRDYPELDRVGKLVELLHPDVYVISGGARGVDQEARLMAMTHHRHLIEITVQGERYVESLFERNTVIVLGSDVVCAFWDGESNGTADTIRKAMHLSGKVIVALPGESPQVWVERM